MLTESTFISKMNEKNEILQQIANHIKPLPYIYMTVDEYLEITPETDKLYWVINNEGKHGVYKNSGLVEGEHIAIHIYGVSWDGGSSTTWTRTDDSANFTEPVPALDGNGGGSPFDSCYPWSGMEDVIIDGNALIKIPKFWYKITKNGSAMTFQIADREKEGFYVSPAHADRGDGKGERDYVYIGKYKCNSSYKSVTGASPIVNITRATARTGITGLGSGYYMQDFAMWWTLRMLYLVEMADWNSQTKIGYGCGNGSSVQNTGASNTMSYHTGTMKSSRTTYGVGVKYRGIEDLWGNVLEWIDGIRFSDADVYVFKTPSQYSDSSGGTKVGTRPTSSNYISAWSIPSVSGYEWALYPSAVSGSGTTYVADFCSYDSSGVVLCAGGSYHQNQNFGLFYLNGDSTATGSYGNVGVRLQYLP